MTTRPFHHGNLRAVLLEQAEVVLRDTGVDGLSLRELARQAGVSHGAPRSHFVDRQALLDALAERGFGRLADRVEHALRTPGTFAERFRLVGRAYVGFGVEDAALMELMFAAKTSGPSDAVRVAAGRLFGLLEGAMAGGGADVGTVDPQDSVRFGFLFAATMQGTATLIASQRITAEQGDALVDDATDLLLTSDIGRRVLPHEARRSEPVDPRL